MMIKSNIMTKSKDDETSATTANEREKTKQQHVNP